MKVAIYTEQLATFKQFGDKYKQVQDILDKYCDEAGDIYFETPYCPQVGWSVNVVDFIETIVNKEEMEVVIANIYEGNAKITGITMYPKYVFLSLYDENV
jgi:hypothetical protein